MIRFHPILGAQLALRFRPGAGAPGTGARGSWGHPGAHLTRGVFQLEMGQDLSNYPYPVVRRERD